MLFTLQINDLMREMGIEPVLLMQWAEVEQEEVVDTDAPVEGEPTEGDSEEEFIESEGHNREILENNFSTDIDDVNPNDIVLLEDEESEEAEEELESSVIAVVPPPPTPAVNDDAFSLDDTINTNPVALGNLIANDVLMTSMATVDLVDASGTPLVVGSQIVLNGNQVLEIVSITADIDNIAIYEITPLFPFTQFVSDSATISIGRDGAVSVLKNSVFDFLKAGEDLTLNFIYSAQDGSGTVSNDANATLTINGLDNQDVHVGTVADENINLGIDNDLILGDGIDLDGSTGGDDVLNGAGGSDNIIGDAFSLINSTGGDDILKGGAGSDFLWGDAFNIDASSVGGIDTFVYDMTADNGNDEIRDFESGKDKILLENITIASLADLDAQIDDVQNIGFGLYAITLANGAGTISLANVLDTAPFEVKFIDESGNEQVLVIIPENGVASNVLLSDGSQLIYNFDTYDVGNGVTDSYTLDDILPSDDIIYLKASTVIFGDVQDMVGIVGGNDVINGGTGTDLLRGDAREMTDSTGGDDILKGGAGTDLLWGDGAVMTNSVGGSDTFVYDMTADNGNDIIYDFESGKDRILLENVTIASLADLDAQIDDISFSFGFYTITLANGAGTISLTNIPTTAPFEVKFIDESGNEQVLVIIPENGDSTNFPLSDGSQLIYNFDTRDGVESHAMDSTVPSDDIVYLKASTAIFGDVQDMVGSVGGNDVINGAAGSDKIYGDADEMTNSTMTSSTGGDDVLNGAGGNDFLYGDAEDMTNSVGGDDIINGESGNDFLYGDAEDMDNSTGGDDVLNGGVGDDFLYGDAEFMTDSTGGDDVLNGESGNNFLWGDAEEMINSTGGNDILKGGGGNDSLWGDAQNRTNSVGGSDTFVYDMTADNGNDIIYDFESGKDRILLENVTIASLADLDAQIENIEDFASFVGFGVYEITLANGAGIISLRNVPDTAPFEVKFIDESGNEQVLVIIPENGVESNVPLSDGSQLIYNFDTSDGIGSFDSYTLDETLPSDDIIYLKASTAIFGDVQDMVGSVGGNDVINGAAGSDKIYGDAEDMDNSTGGDDVIKGGMKNDRLWGDAYTMTNSTGGDDILKGGAGSDFLWGDGVVMTNSVGGSDTFVYDMTADNGDDTIYDFESGKDRILLENVTIASLSDLDAQIDDVQSFGLFFYTITLANGAGTISLTNIPTTAPFEVKFIDESGNEQVLVIVPNGLSGGVYTSIALDNSTSELVYTFDGFVDLSAGTNGGGADDIIYTKDLSNSQFIIGDVESMSNNSTGGDDILNGSGDNDLLFGDARLMIDSTGGDDIIQGGGGDDFLWGDGAVMTNSVGGSDTFVYDADIDNGSDEIRDFEAGKDKILLENVTIASLADLDAQIDDVTFVSTGIYLITLANGAGTIRLEGLASTAPFEVKFIDESGNEQVLVIIPENGVESNVPLSDGSQLIYNFDTNDGIGSSDSYTLDETLPSDDIIYLKASTAIFGDVQDMVGVVGGNDVINGGAGTDLLRGDAEFMTDSTGGDDIIKGGAGTDLLWGDGVVMTNSVGGSDTFVYDMTADNGDDTIYDFEAGKDKILLENVTIASIADLDAQIDDVEDLTGGKYKITLANGAGTIRLEGLADTAPFEVKFIDESGNEQMLVIVPDGLSGGAATPIALDNSTSELVYTFDGFVDLSGGTNGGGADDIINGGAGTDLLLGDARNMTNSIGGDDIIKGGAGTDFLYGDAGEMTNSVGGDDILKGGAGVDRLYGDAGTMIDSTGGDDIIKGGGGDDFLWGDGVVMTNSVGGSDTFVYDMGLDNGSDTIVNFESGKDKILLENVTIASLSDLDAQIADVAFVIAGVYLITLANGAGTIRLEGLADTAPFEVKFIDESGNEQVLVIVPDGLSGGLYTPIDLDNSTSELVYTFDDLVTLTAGTNGGGADDIIYTKDFSNSQFITGDVGTMIDSTGGDDIINSAGGNDFLFGDADDMTDSTGGNDVLKGGGGNDSLWGDGIVMTNSIGGSDTFVYDADINNGSDEIHDFRLGEDVLRFENVLDGGNGGEIDALDILVENVSGNQFTFTNDGTLFATIDFVGTSDTLALSSSGTLQDLINQNTGLSVEINP